MNRKTILAALLPCALLAVAFAEAEAAASRLPSDLRPVAAETSARGAWVNPAGFAADHRPSLVFEMAWRERSDEFDFSDPAAVTVAISTDNVAYSYRRELEDVPGVPDWVVSTARRNVSPNGFAWGSTVEWRGGEEQRVDGTIGVLVPLMSAIRAAVVVEDVLQTDVDGIAGDRRWRGGLSARPRGLPGYLAWDYDRFEDADEGRHWFSFGVDRAQTYGMLLAIDDQGNWSGRFGIGFGTATPSLAILNLDGGGRMAFATFEARTTPQILR